MGENQLNLLFMIRKLDLKEISQQSVNVDRRSWILFNVTEHIERWIKLPESNKGLILRAFDEINGKFLIENQLLCDLFLIDLLKCNRRPSRSGDVRHTLFFDQRRSGAVCACLS